MIKEDKLIKRFDSSTEALVDVWKKKHAGKRVKSLLDRNMFSRESHFYDDIIFMDNNQKNLPLNIAFEMRRYIENHVKNGGRPHQITRHMMGLFHGMPGAKAWKQNLSSITCSGSLEYYDSAVNAVSAELRSTAA